MTGTLLLLLVVNSRQTRHSIIPRWYMCMYQRGMTRVVDTCIFKINGYNVHRRMHACTQIDTCHICVRACMHTNTHSHACVHACMHASCMHVYMYAPIHLAHMLSLSLTHTCYTDKVFNLQWYDTHTYFLYRQFLQLTLVRWLWTVNTLIIQSYHADTCATLKIRMWLICTCPKSMDITCIGVCMHVHK